MKTYLYIFLCLVLSACATHRPLPTNRVFLSGLDLSNIPDSVYAIKHLTSLSLGAKAAVIGPWGGKVASLKNHLRYLPDSICRLQYLQELNLSFNQITELPPCFASLQQLTKLDLMGNSDFDIRKAMPILLSLKKLEELNLYSITSVYRDTAWVRAQLAGRVSRLSITDEDLLRYYSPRKK